MDIVTEINEEITRYLRLSAQPGLADRLDEVPQEKRDALYNMVALHEYHKVQKTIIAFQVKEDVLACLEGREMVFAEQG
jgi:hypothetical protein